MKIMNYVPTKDYVWKEVSSQVVILHVDSGMYWTLNNTSSLIWNGIINSTPMDQIVQQICDEFSADEKTVLKDVEIMVRDFLDKKMIEVN